MIVHVYTLSWNEGRMMPFFLDYYSFADKIIIYDNMSTDNTTELIKGKAELHTFNTNNTFREDIQTTIRNTCWLKSKGIADWVILVDVDEHVYHPDLQHFLKTAKTEKYTVLKAEGYNMWSESFPEYGKPLTEQIKTGWYWEPQSKMSIFNPNEIASMNFDVGLHNASPVGNVNILNSGYKLLHYKIISREYYVNRNIECGKRLSNVNIKNGWSRYCLLSQNQLGKMWNQGRKIAVTVHD